MVDQSQYLDRKSKALFTDDFEGFTVPGTPVQVGSPNGASAYDDGLAQAMSSPAQTVSPEQRAAAALLLRKRMRMKETLENLGLMDFTKQTNPLYIAQPFHELLASTLEKVLNGEILRLMVWTPPQHGKSELISVRFPAYWLGMRPNDPVMIASYGSDLANSKSRQARDIVESDVYQQLFPYVKVARDNRSEDFWGLSAPYRGSMKAVGVGGAATGNGARLAIIDDPIKNPAEANSPTHQRHILDWYRQVFRTRVWEGGPIVLVMTRWSENDLAGQLLKLSQSSDADPEEQIPWTILRLPAMAETQEERDMASKRLGLPIGQPDPLGRPPGEALAPRLFSIVALRAIKQDVGSYTWNTLYQANPMPAEGNLFKREWFKQRVNKSTVPKDCIRIRYWDKAATDENGACRTAGVLMAYDKHYGLVYVEDVVVGRWTALKREEVMLATAKRDAIVYGSRSAVLQMVEQEPGSGGKESAEATVRKMIGYRVKKDRPTGDKDTRLQPFAAQCEGGNVLLVDAPWNEEYVDEIIAIPNAAVRDVGDSSSGAFNNLTGRKVGGAKANTRNLYLTQKIQDLRKRTG